MNFGLVRPLELGTHVLGLLCHCRVQAVWRTACTAWIMVVSSAVNSTNWIFNRISDWWITMTCTPRKSNTIEASQIFRAWWGLPHNMARGALSTMSCWRYNQSIAIEVSKDFVTTCYSVCMEWKCLHRDLQSMFQRNIRTPQSYCNNRAKSRSITSVETALEHGSCAYLSARHRSSSASTGWLQGDASQLDMLLYNPSKVIQLSEPA